MKKKLNTKIQCKYLESMDLKNNQKVLYVHRIFLTDKTFLH